jgi:hypothetical protein
MNINKRSAKKNLHSIDVASVKSCSADIEKNCDGAEVLTKKDYRKPEIKEVATIGDIKIYLPPPSPTGGGGPASPPAPP